MMLSLSDPSDKVTSVFDDSQEIFLLTQEFSSTLPENPGLTGSSTLQIITSANSLRERQHTHKCQGLGPERLRGGIILPSTYMVGRRGS